MHGYFASCRDVLNACTLVEFPCTKVPLSIYCGVERPRMPGGNLAKCDMT